MCKTPSETLEMLMKVYNDSMMSSLKVYKWYRCFEQLQGSIADNEDLNHPATSRTEANKFLILKELFIQKFFLGEEK